MSTEQAQAVQAVQAGDKVSWNWNGNNPSGVASEIKPGDVTVVSHRGNEISKTGTENDPAVHIERSGNDVVKTASELTVENTGEQNGPEKDKREPEDNRETEGKRGPEEKREENKQEDKVDEEKRDETNGDEPQAGDKRKADERADAPTEPEKSPEKVALAEEAPEIKKQKTTNGANTNGDKKGPGRPKVAERKASGPKKEKKIPRIGTAARKTRSQGSTANEAL